MIIEPEIFWKQHVYTMNGDKFNFKVYMTADGYLAESEEFAPFLVNGRDQYELYDNMHYFILVASGKVKYDLGRFSPVMDAV